MKKILLFLLIILSVITPCLLFTSCSAKNIKGVILTEEVYNKSVKKKLSGKFEISDKLYNEQIDYLIDGRKYYAVLCFKNTNVNTRETVLEVSTELSVDDIIIKAKEGDDVFNVSLDSREETENSNGEKCYRYKIKYSGDKKKSTFTAVVAFTPNKTKLLREAFTFFRFYANSNDLISFYDWIVYEKHVKTSASIKYITEEDYNSGSFNDKLRDSIEMIIGEKYYAVVDFTFSHHQSITEEDTALLEINKEGMDNADVGAEQFPTGDFTDDGKTIRARFRFYGNGQTQVRFILSITPIDGGDSELIPVISGDKISFVYADILTNLKDEPYLYLYDENKTYKSTVTVNAELKTESKLEYTLSSDGSYYIVTGLGGESQSSLTVPGTYKDIPVKEIAENVFSDIKHIEEVFISEGVEKIGAGAFRACSSLESVHIPTSVTAIGANAFADCDSAFFFCYSDEKPSSWGDGWNSGNTKINWGSGKLIFTLNSDKRTYMLSESGYTASEVYIPSMYNGRPVTAVAAGAFRGKNLTKVSIPDSIVSLGDFAFAECESLIYNEKGGLKYLGNSGTPYLILAGADASVTSVTPDGTTKFILSHALDGITGLGTVTLTQNIIGIGAYAFNGCTGLGNIQIPSSMLTIGEGAFLGCTGVSSLTFAADGGSLAIGKAAFAGLAEIKNLVIPERVQSLGAGAFEGCAALESITLPFIGGRKASYDHFAYIFNAEYVSSLNNKAEKVPSALKTVTVTAETELGHGAFAGCAGIEAVSLSSTVVKMGAGTFSGCTSLREIIIPFVGDSTSSEYKSPFGYIFSSNAGTGLVKTEQHYNSKNDRYTTDTYYLPETLRKVTVLGGNVNNGAFYNCGMLTEIVLPSTLTKISDSAFLNCSSIESIVIPAGVGEIEGWSFYGCTSLKELVLSPDCKIKSIGHRAFQDCSSFTSFTIPSSVTTISSYVFEGCTRLQSITVPANVTSIDEGCFGGCDNLTEIIFADTTTWYVVDDEDNITSGGTEISVASPSQNAINFKNTYRLYAWYKK